MLAAECHPSLSAVVAIRNSPSHHKSSCAQQYHLTALQVAPELQVWDKLTTELCRQTRVECSQRGVLLLTAVIRQRQLLHMALSACNDMFSRMQEVSKGAQQLHQTVGDLQIELGHKQQQHENLQVCA